MADPTPYSRSYSFSGYQTATPSAPLPGQQVDTQLDAIAAANAGVITALKDIRRSDGKLAANSVGPEQLSPTITVGYTLRGTWATGTYYTVGDGVVYGTTFYRAKVSHTAGATTPDVDTTNWQFLFTLPIATSTPSIRYDAPQGLNSTQQAQARSNAGLGNSATLNTGTTTGTVAAGDDVRLVGAVRTDIAQGLASGAKNQARANIDAFGTGGGTITGDLNITGQIQFTTGTSGMIRLNAAGDHFLSWDGTNYALGGSPGTPGASGDLYLPNGIAATRSYVGDFLNGLRQVDAGNFQAHLAGGTYGTAPNGSFIRAIMYGTSDLTISAYYIQYNRPNFGWVTIT